MNRSNNGSGAVKSFGNQDRLKRKEKLRGKVIETPSVTINDQNSHSQDKSTPSSQYHLSKSKQTINEFPSKAISIFAMFSFL